MMTGLCSAMCVLDVGQDAVVEHGWCVESWAVVMLQTQAEELAVGVYATGGGGGGAVSRALLVVACSVSYS
jgi:hypothetical protein